MATKAKATPPPVVDPAPVLAPTAAATAAAVAHRDFSAASSELSQMLSRVERAKTALDPAQIAAAAEATATASVTQRRAILTQLAQATQIPEADLLILFGLPN